MLSLNDRRGVGLLEVVVALSIFALASLGIFASYRTSLGGWEVAQQFASEQQNARSFLEILSRKVRMIGAGYAGTVTDPAIYFGDAAQIQFRADMDGDGAAECYRIFLENLVAYEQTSTTCDTVTSAPRRALTSARDAGRLDVISLIFAYYDAATVGALPLPAPLSLQDRAFTRRVAISVTIRGLSNPFSMSTQAVIR